MTHDDDFIGLLEGYLEEYEGSTPLPGSVRDAVRARIPTTMQRPAWWPERRFPSMNTYMRIALASVAVVAAAVIGLSLWQGQNVGGPGIDDTSPSPVTTPAPSVTSFDTTRAGEPLAPGAYFTTVASYRFTFTVPAGWQRNVVPRVLWTGNSEARVSFGQLENINADPCQPELGELDPPLGPTADDLASALAAIPGVEAATSTEEISGIEARRVQLDVPDEFGDCVTSGGEAVLNGEAPLEPGTHRFWIIDLDLTRLVIHAVDRPGASARQVEELDAIVASIQIDAP